LGKCENSRDDLGQLFSKYKEVNNISYKTTNKMEDKAGEKVLLTPRKRKSQRTLQKIDQILDNVDTPQDFENKIISKLKYEITDIYLKKENEEEKVEVTPRKRKTKRTFEKINQILEIVDRPQNSKI
jgi:Txe/YoeB family toxin of Txe-Axe toxin-antitoxin module